LINDGDDSYISSSTVGRVPPIDSIGQEFEEESTFGVAGVRTNFFARDPVGFGDIPPIRDATNPVGGDDDDETPPWETGDEIKVEIHSISNAAFFFMEIARDQITNGDNGLFATPLANTRGNIINQATGERALGVQATREYDHRE